MSSFEGRTLETYYKVGARSARVFVGKNKEKYKFSREFFTTQNEKLARRFLEDAKRNPRENQEPCFEVFELPDDYYSPNQSRGLAFSTEDEYKEFLDKWCNLQAIAGRFD